MLSLHGPKSVMEGLRGENPKGAPATGFNLSHDPAPPLGFGSKLVDQHRLAHPA
jgi:hypothetical protein